MMNHTNQLRTFLLLGGILLATVGAVVFFMMQLVPLAHQIMGNASPGGTFSAAAMPPGAPTLSSGPVDDSGVPTPTATVAVLVALLEATIPAGKTAMVPVASSDNASTPTIAEAAEAAATPVPRAVIDGDLVNVRSAPSIAGEILAQIGKAQEVVILDTSADGQWYKICCPLGTHAERESWIHIDNTRPLPVTNATGDESADNGLALRAAHKEGGDPAHSGVVNGSVVNIRSGPGTHYTIIGQVNEATIVNLTGRTASNEWLQICCPVPSNGNGEGWVSALLIDIAGERDAIIAALPVPPTPVPPTPPPIAQLSNSPPASTQAQAGLGAGPGLPGPGGFGAPGDTNPLTGLALPGGRGAQRPVIVCVNNDPAARPQLGLSQADVLYEYLMEGYGITRFSAIYYGDESAQIGPVRSARLINYTMGALYDAGLVCSGASDAVRYSLKHEAPFPYLDIDLDDPSNSRYSVSIGTDYRTRLRTSTNGAHQWLADWGVENAPSLRGFTFGGLGGGGAPAAQIDIPYPRATGSQVHYQYDGATGRYLRWLGGNAHTDGNSGAQLAFDNVIVQYVTHEATNIVEDSLGSTSIRLNLFGSGRALLFRDGVAFVGTWRSESRGDLPHFYNESGQEIALKPGRSWISIAPDSYTTSYQ